MFESFPNFDHWSEDDRWCGSKGILKKFEVNRIPLLGMIGIGIMDLVEKSYKVKSVKVVIGMNGLG